MTRRVLLVTLGRTLFGLLGALLGYVAVVGLVILVSIAWWAFSQPWAPVIPVVAAGIGFGLGFAGPTVEVDA